MQTAHLTNAGHLIIPAAILEACHLNAGQELEIEITDQGILLKIIYNMKQPDLSAIDAFRGKGKGGRLGAACCALGAGRTRAGLDGIAGSGGGSGAGLGLRVVGGGSSVGRIR